MTAKSHSNVQSILNPLKGLLWLAATVFTFVITMRAGIQLVDALAPQEAEAKVETAPTAIATPRTALQTSTPVPSPTPLPTPTPVLPTPTLTQEPVYIAVPRLIAGEGGVNVRRGPGTAYEKIGYLASGAEAAITGWSGAWWQIAYEGTAAFVFGDVVTAYDANGLPEVQAPPLPETTPEVEVAPIPDPAPVWAIDEARWIDVALSTQTLTAYEGQTPVNAYLVSTGLSQTPTPTGQYRIWIKLKTDDMAGADYYIEHVPWVMYFFEGYGLHGVTWHANFGHPMSHGCVNQPNDMAEWLFNFADVGTLVNIHE